MTSLYACALQRIDGAIPTLRAGIHMINWQLHTDNLYEYDILFMCIKASSQHIFDATNPERERERECNKKTILKRLNYSTESIMGMP